MATGCLLVGSNPDEDHRLVEPERDYLEVRERDPAALAGALIGLLDNRSPTAEVARRGERRIRELCDVRAVVVTKLDAMGC